MATEENSTRLAAANLDTDKDGLKDWEETLWKTNLQNPDTDGDGTNDGAEVAAGRNPAVAGPKDNLTTNIVKDAGTTNKSIESFSITNELAKGVFSNYMQTQSGLVSQTITDGANAALVDQAQTSATIKLYDIKDIKLTDDDSNQATQNYLNNWIGILAKYSYYKDQNEPELLKKALLSRSPENIQAVADAALAYKHISDELLALSVPRVMVNVHMAFLNVYYGMYQSVSQMSKSLEDPVLGMIGLRNARAYNEAIVSLFNTLKLAAQS